jgi:hypothetical protein
MATGTMMVTVTIIIGTGVTATIKLMTTTLGVSIATIARVITCATIIITRNGIPAGTAMTTIAIGAITMIVITTIEGTITTRKRALR